MTLSLRNVAMMVVLGAAALLLALIVPALSKNAAHAQASYQSQSQWQSTGNNWNYNSNKNWNNNWYGNNHPVQYIDYRGNNSCWDWCYDNNDHKHNNRYDNDHDYKKYHKKHKKYSPQKFYRNYFDFDQYYRGDYIDGDPADCYKVSGRKNLYVCYKYDYDNWDW